MIKQQIHQWKIMTMYFGKKIYLQILKKRKGYDRYTMHQMYKWK